MSYNNKTTVKICKDWAYCGSIVYFVQERDGKTYVAKPVELEFVHVQDGERCEPTLTLPDRVDKAFFQALAEALDGENIKTDKDAKIEGTLDATKYHLSDLRQLLKLKK